MTWVIVKAHCFVAIEYVSHKLSLVINKNQQMTFFLILNHMPVNENMAAI